MNLPFGSDVDPDEPITVLGDHDPALSVSGEHLLHHLETNRVTIAQMDDLIVNLDPNYRLKDGQPVRYSGYRDPAQAQRYLAIDRDIVRRWLDQFHIPHE
jgi:hypothetical protein